MNDILSSDSPYMPSLTTNDLLYVNRLDTQWLTEHLAVPLLHTTVAEPFNAFASSLEVVSSMPTPRLSIMPIQTQFLSKEWICQSLANGIGSALTLCVSQALTKRAFGRIGLHLSNTSATLIGGSFYEFLKEPQPGHSRFGNLVAGAVMIGTFETGNSLLKGSSSFRTILGRSVTGALGASGHTITSSLLDRKRMPQRKELLQSLGSGIFMNVVLPPLQSKLFGDSAMPIERNTQPSIAQTPEPQSKITGSEVQPSALAELGFKTSSCLIPKDSKRINFKSIDSYSDTGTMYEFITFENFKSNKNDVLISIASDGTFPCRPRAEFLAKALEGLPNPSFIKQVTVMLHSHPMETWWAKVTGGKTRIYGETEGNGIIKLFHPETKSTTWRTLCHEYSHLIKADSLEGELYNRAALLEPFLSFRGESHPLMNPNESWAFLGETILTANKSKFVLTGLANPILTSIFMSRLKDVIKLPNGINATRANRYQDHLRITETLLHNQALLRLEMMEGQAALDVICFLKSKK